MHEPSIKAIPLWETEAPRGETDQKTTVRQSLENIKQTGVGTPKLLLKKQLADAYDLQPSMDAYVLEDGERHPAMLICPGGAYLSRAKEHEGRDIAQWLNSMGISAFVLDYRCAPYPYPISLWDAKRAMRHIRCHAPRYRIDPQRLGVIGFSAGGHLAACLGTLFDAGDSAAKDAVERESSRPDWMVLCYPVITMGVYTHALSKVNLLGANPAQAQADLLSCEKQVTPATPPAFLWHTENDAGVPVQNTLLFAQALEENQIPYETHIFPDGRHGLGLAKGVKDVCEWPARCESWLRSQAIPN